ncbi:MAG: hypothetical protein R2860_05735 [Desulfobacterales bacterium]
MSYLGGINAEVHINSTDRIGIIPVLKRIRRNETAGALMLIENGAPVNAAGDMGKPRLHVAVSNKNMTVIDALIKRGARTDIVN